MFQFESRIQALSLQQNKLDHDKNFKSSEWGEESIL